MGLARKLVVRIVALLFAALGIWLIIAPRWVETLYGIELQTPMAVSEMRAVFGGMMLGVGVVVLWFDLVRNDLRAGADVLIFVTSGLLVARVVGVLMDGLPHGPVRNETIFEAALVIILLILFRKRREPG